MKQYTRPPWKVKSGSGGYLIYDQDKSVRMGSEEDRRLIELAPELLEAAEDLLIKLRGPLSEVFPAIKNLDLIISKVHGDDV